MNPSGKKAGRLLQIETLLLAHPQGLTAAEIARRLDVNRSTVSRYVSDISPHVYIDDLDGNKWKIDRSAYPVNVRFTLHEALSIHLATRLLATRMDRQNPHAAAALRKLGVSLEKLAPRISHHMLQSANVMDATAQRHDPRYVQVVEKLTVAWAEQYKVDIWHRHEGSGKIVEYVFAPYFIEPYAVGRTTHVIGWRARPGALRTFKIERIERIEPRRHDRYTTPNDFDPADFLADAWGIWYTEAEPQTVVLKFSRKVAGRVQETKWHRSEKTELQPDGSLLWMAQVAEPQEMVNWVRGWGADVEVLEPAGLRMELIRETKRLMQTYGLQNSDQPDRDDPDYHQKRAKSLFRS